MVPTVDETVAYRSFPGARAPVDYRFDERREEKRNGLVYRSKNKETRSTLTDRNDE